MQEQGSPSLERSAPILVASGAQDEQAMELVKTLREAGLRVVFAENTSIAALTVDEAAASVAVLRPDTWKAQTISTILRAKPACLIPVLAEPMELPRGPWTEQAIDLSTDYEQGVQRLLQTVRERLAKDAASLPQKKKTEPTPTFTPLTLKPRRVIINRSALLSTVLLMLLIVGLVALLVYSYVTHPITTQTNTSNISPAIHTNNYSAAIPGPDCNPGGDQWQTGDHYVKTVNKQQVEVLDKYTTLQCQARGALVTRSGDYDIYSEIFFNGPGGEGSLSTHYFAQVNATILSGDTQTSLTMDVHLQANTYGRYGFNVNTLGHWEANVGSPKDGSSINRMALGFLPQTSKTYTLAIEVNGPDMTFFINGTQVTSVTDTTYSDNDSLAFGVSDATATSPVSALFSNFQYKALPALLRPEQAVATATAVAQQALQTPYATHVPGYNCDKKGGQWQPVADTNNPGILHCQAGGMQLMEPANTKLIAEEDFYWLNGHFPHNYKVSARIDVSNAGNRCAALGTRENSDVSNYGSYDFLVCPDGSWAIVLLTDKFDTLAQGTIYASNAYTVTAESNGSAQSLYIDGQLVQTVTDATLSNTDHISLDAGLYTANQQTSATFSDFTFTPLP